MKRRHQAERSVILQFDALRDSRERIRYHGLWKVQGVYLNEYHRFVANPLMDALKEETETQK